MVAIVPKNIAVATKEITPVQKMKDQAWCGLNSPIRPVTVIVATEMRNAGVG